MVCINDFCFIDKGFWKDSFTICDKNVLERLHITGETERFLTEYGIPNIKKILPYENIIFYLCNDFILEKRGNRELVVIGECEYGGTKLCINNSTHEIGYIKIDSSSDFKLLTLA